jgi:pyridinium-3,5-biscarboxylic acid mononucleotide synthase
VEFEMDWARVERVGIPEAVLCSHKSPAQIDAIITAARVAENRLLLTRLDAELFDKLALASRTDLDFDVVSRTGILGGAVPMTKGAVGIVAAGTSDFPVASEAARTLAFLGHEAPIICDVGVAGIWRLMDRLEVLRSFAVVIAVAGMEGALFSVLGGLVAAPVVAVPTSVGYGVGRDGMSALHSALASCSPGVVVVNIDNGFGAAMAARKMLRIAERS